MELREIIDTLYTYVQEKYDLADDPDYTTDVNLFDYGYLDSLGATEVIVWLEEHYGIEITQKDIILYPMDTIEEIAEVVYGKVK